MPNFPTIAEAGSHKINRQKAKELINKHRVAREAGHPVHPIVKGGTFNVEDIKAIINKVDANGNHVCKGLRYYFAMERAGDVAGVVAGKMENGVLKGEIKANDEIPTIVIVGVDENGGDIITTTDTSASAMLDSAAESSWPCPPHCPTGIDLSS